MHANPRGGLAFDDDDVARAYVHRPPYPAELYQFLNNLPAKRRRALDLGCGPGKIAHGLAEAFDEIDAVDPSAAMLRIADHGLRRNINWIHGFAETADLADAYDLVTAGASIHWMDHRVLFPRLAALLDPGGYVAVVDGDDAHDVPWQSEWEAFLARWVARLGNQYDPAAYRERMTSYRAWLDVAGERTFTGSFKQRIEHFIECQHSRATWSRTNLGPELAAEFDDDLRLLLGTYAADGLLTFGTQVEVVWGRARVERV